MSELALKLYEHFKSEKYYYLSKDPLTKKLELDAIKELENLYYIDIRLRTIGYIIADIC